MIHQDIGVKFYSTSMPRRPNNSSIVRSNPRRVTSETLATWQTSDCVLELPEAAAAL